MPWRRWWGRGGIAPIHFWPGTRWGWVVSITPQPVEASLFEQVFKLLATNFEVLIDMECNGCLHLPQHVHSDFITLRSYLVLQFLNIYWSIIVNDKLQVTWLEQCSLQCSETAWGHLRQCLNCTVVRMLVFDQILVILSSKCFSTDLVIVKLITLEVGMQALSVNLKNSAAGNLISCHVFQWLACIVLLCGLCDSSPLESNAHNQC
jgi:hypothetical protein